MKYNKLVRDNIPEIIHAQGKDVCFRVLSKDEFPAFLENKLDEEVAELHEAVEFHKDKILEELADIVEVIYALAEVHGHTVFELGRMRRRKLFERGGFTRKVCLIETYGDDENDGFDKLH